jgi:hypothetical protein
MSLIALTLTVAGITLHRDAVSAVYDFPAHREVAIYTGTDGVTMFCTSRGRITWQWLQGAPALLIVVDTCKPDVIFRGRFQ